MWFDSGSGYPIAGEVTDVSRSRISIKSHLNGKIFAFPMDETNRILSRTPLPAEGVNDMITMSDLSEASILWNIKVRYDHRQFYVGVPRINQHRASLVLLFPLLDLYRQHSCRCQSVLHVSRHVLRRVREKV